MKDYADLKRSVQERIAGESELSDTDIKHIIYETLADEQKNEFMDIRERARISKKLFDSLRGLDVIQSLAEDDDVTDIIRIYTRWRDWIRSVRLLKRRILPIWTFG